MATSKIHKERVRELLWTNPSPTSSFLAQTILTADLSGYDYIEVWAMLYTSFQHLIPVVQIPIGKQGNLTGVAGNANETSGYGVLVTRGVTVLTDKIVAAEGYGVQTNGGQWAVNNSNAIPWKIFGIKE
jgi:hypothetical protein